MAAEHKSGRTKQPSQIEPPTITTTAQPAPTTKMPPPTGAQPAPKGNPPSPAVTAGPPLAVLPGEFALETWEGSGVITYYGDANVYGPGTSHYLTAVSGGGACCGALHTDARQVASWERFKLLVLGNGQFAIQTLRGYYLGAGNGGGMGANVNDWALFTTETTIGDYAKYRLLQQQDSGTYAIQTPNGINYVTAVGGGGRATDVIHTDATKAGSWEQWRLVKAGDLGSGYCYGIQAFTGFFLSAPGGGGRTTDAILSVSRAMGPAHSPERFRLMRQGDGSYAIQTANGNNYVTAVNGGGLVQGSATWNILQTNRTQVQAWEKFRLVDQGDGTYAIQTVSGYYLGLYPTAGVHAFTTDRSVVGPGEKFKLIWCDRLS